VCSSAVHISIGASCVCWTVFKVWWKSCSWSFAACVGVIAGVSRVFTCPGIGALAKMRILVCVCAMVFFSFVFVYGPTHFVLPVVDDVAEEFCCFFCVIFC